MASLLTSHEVQYIRTNGSADSVFLQGHEIRGSEVHCASVLRSKFLAEPDESKQNYSIWIL
jgi:hypothetical protein